MTLAAILTTLLVVILQIITISLLRDTRKKVRELAEQKPVTPSYNGERRDRDFKANRRPNQENRQKPQASVTSSTTANVEQVDKLRDINLKLKNAERDQEFTRKKMQDNFLKDSNRRRENGKGGNRDHRHGDRRNNWQDRNRRDQNSQVQQSAQESSPSEIKEEIAKTSQIEQAQIQKTASVTPSSTPELIPSDFGSEENMQHGRRFSSKRRFSSEESRSDSIGSENSSSEQMHEATQDNDSENSTEKNADAEIKFGRR